MMSFSPLESNGIVHMHVSNRKTNGARPDFNEFKLNKHPKIQMFLLSIITVYEKARSRVATLNRRAYIKNVMMRVN